MKYTCLCAALCLFASTNVAHAYDLSRQDYDDEKIERGFVHAKAGFWFPGFGSFETYHQLSLEFGGEVGFRVASIRGEHNIFILAGLMVSPQKLDPEVVDSRHANTQVFLPYAGVRYLPSALCFGDGLGCLFAELRLGFAFEHADSRSGHDGPKGDVTILPGVGYRFRFGALQLGARADIAFSGEDDSRDLSWLDTDAFIGASW